jgi:putative ABC transport system permease protein
MMSAADESVNGAMGFDKDNVLIGQMNLPERSYDTPGKRTRFVDEVIASMRAIPAATNVGFTTHQPYAGANDGRRFWLEGQDALREDEVRLVNYRRIEGDYFGAMRIPLIAGRPFTGADRDGSQPVALVSAGLASDYWPNQDPIGRRFKVAAQGEYITVVGVVGNVVHNWLRPGIDRTVYRPVKQQPPLRAVFAIRTVGDPLSLAGDLRRAVAKADPDLPIAVLNSMTGGMETQASGIRFIAKSLGVVAFVAFVLAVMGIYSLMAYLTGQRTQEIGVRMALGAGGWQVIRLTTNQAIAIIVAGTITGAALSAGLGQLMRSVLLGVITIHWGQLALVVFVLFSVALMAAYIPARRASRIDPMSALRET